MTMATISTGSMSGYGPQITTAVAPRTSTTVTDVPGGRRGGLPVPTADQTSPPILTCPPSASTVDTTVAFDPMSASMPLRIVGRLVVLAQQHRPQSEHQRDRGQREHDQLQPQQFREEQRDPGGANAPPPSMSSTNSAPSTSAIDSSTAPANQTHADMNSSCQCGDCQPRKFGQRRRFLIDVTDGGDRGSASSGSVTKSISRSTAVISGVSRSR